MAAVAASVAHSKRVRNTHVRFSVEARGDYECLQGRTSPEDRKHHSSQAGITVFRGMTIFSSGRDGCGQLHTEGPGEAGIYI